ncbi:MAG: hypothetical protein SO286_00605, partial [Candidatus Enterosoma sp.]|nr:hypothetical protein [Candidatus Enterosoma sp.]
GASSFPESFRTKCGKSLQSGRKGPKGQAFSAFSAASGEGFPVSPCRVLAYACRFGGIPDGPV